MRVTASITVTTVHRPSFRPGPTYRYEGTLTHTHSDGPKGALKIHEEASDEARLSLSLGSLTPQLFYSRWREGVFSVVVTTMSMEYTIISKTADVSGLQDMVRSLMGVAKGQVSESEKENRPCPATPGAAPGGPQKRRCAKSTPSPVKLQNGLSPQQSGALQLFLSGKRNMFVTGEEKTNDDSVGSGTQHLVVFSL